jgi:hypothetical protein
MQYIGVQRITQGLIQGWSLRQSKSQKCAFESKNVCSLSRLGFLNAKGANVGDYNFALSDVL